MEVVRCTNIIVFGKEVNKVDSVKKEKFDPPIG